MIELTRFDTFEKLEMIVNLLIIRGKRYEIIWDNPDDPEDYTGWVEIK